MSVKLSDLINHSLPTNPTITSLSCDSRTISPGTLFFAIKGDKHDSHKFIPEVIEKGAACIISEEDCSSYTKNYVRAPNIRSAIADLASKFYNNATLTVPTIGITGTNGKTSIAWILTSLLKNLNKPTAYIGTLGFVSCKENTFLASANTSPEPIALYSFLDLERKAEAFVVEVTSQGLVQERSRNVAWDIAVFTNLSRDHLDLHGSIENYADAKKLLFTKELVASPKENKLAIINLDDEFGARLLEELSCHCLSYSSCSQNADVFLKNANLTSKGAEIEVSIGGADYHFKTQLVGRYNLSNTLAVLAIASSLDLDLSSIEFVKSLQAVPSVPGRLELLSKNKISVFVDYAHTPDALDSVQSSLLELGPERLITVFGCGGDRDRGKRLLMGASVAKKADVAIVTSDNPRTEDPEAIIADILPAFVDSNYEVIPDRQKAIQHAIKIAQPGDFVLVAGKGHEDYQEINGERLPFVDLEVCRAALEEI